MDAFFLTVVNMSLTGSIVIIAVLAIRLLLRRAPKIFSYLLWIVVLFRLVCPFALTTNFGMPQTLVNHQTALTQNLFYGMQGIEQPNALASDAKIESMNQQNQNQDILTSDEDQTTDSSQISNTSKWNKKYYIMEHVWMLGIALLLLYSLASYGYLKEKLRNARFVEQNVYEVEKLPTPFVLGFFRPYIYLPSGIAGEEREYILAHEGMHIRRLDYIVKLIGFLVVIIHWMNPLVWIAFCCMTKDMEMSCDEAVIKNFGSEIKKEYSMSLLHMAMPQKGLNIAPLAFGEGNVKSRIKNVLKYKKAGMNILIICACMLLLAVGILTTNRSVTTAEDKIRLSRVNEELVDNSSILLEHKLNEDANSYMVFAVSFADGQEVERNVVASGNITDENRKGDLDLSFQYMKEADDRLTITATDGANSQFKTYILNDYNMHAGNIMWNQDNSYHNIVTNLPYLITTEYIGSQETTGIQVFDCLDLVNDESIWDAAMEQSADSGITMYMVYYVIFDKQIEDMSVDLDSFPLHVITSETDESGMNSSEEDSISKTQPTNESVPNILNADAVKQLAEKHSISRRFS